MTDPPASVESARPRRRLRLRYSLRGMLIATTLLAVGLAWFIHRVQNEERAAEAIEAAYGEIVYDWQVRPPDAAPDAPPPQPPAPTWLRRRLGPHWFDSIVEVRLNGYANPVPKNRFSLVGPHLVKLPALRSLTVWGGHLTPDDYRTLGRLTQLDALRLRQEREIEPRSVRALAGAMGLRELHLDAPRISPVALCELAALPHLEELDIDCVFHDPQTGKDLDLAQLDDDAAHELAQLTQLRSLMLFGATVTDRGMADLCRLRQLKTLVVSSPRVTSASFAYVATLQRLEHLGTWQWQIDGADFARLAPLPRLRSLGLVTKMTDEAAAELVHLPQLERLSFSSDQITDASLPVFAQLQRLEWLDLKNTKAVKNGPAATELRQALPKCLIILPHTPQEEAMEQAFHNSKFGVGTPVASP